MRLLKAILFLLLLGGIGYQANAYYEYRKAAQKPPPRVKTVTARGGTLRITLSGTGTLQALESRVVAVREVSSRLVRIVNDGDMVKAGQIVAELETTQLLKDLRERQAAYDTAKAAVPKAEVDVMLNLNNAATKTTKARQEQELLVTTNVASIDQAKAELQFKGSELSQAERKKTRTESLVRDQLMPQRDLERAELSVQGAELNVTTSEKSLEVQEHTSKINVSKGDMLIEDARYAEEAARNKAEQQRQNARFNMLQARRMLEMTQRQLDYCKVTTPIAGMAVVQQQWDPSQGGRRPFRAGDQVYPSRALMEIINTARMIVQADVGEIDIGHVRKGQKARVFPRAAPGTSLRARVKSVSEVAQTPPYWRANRAPGKKVFRVVLELLEARPRLLRPGMTADFELVEEEVAGGARVPIQSVFTRRKERVVYIRKGGRFWPKPVKLGKRNDNDVLVLQGVKPGDVLAEKVPPASLIGPAKQEQRTAQSRARRSGVQASGRSGVEDGPS